MKMLPRTYFGMSLFAPKKLGRCDDCGRHGRNTHCVDQTETEFRELYLCDECRRARADQQAARKEVG